MPIQIRQALLALLLLTTSADAAGELVQIRLAVTSSGGIPLAEVAIGEPFELRAFVADLRPSGEAGGVFAAYLDVAYDGAKATVTGPITFGAAYPNGTSGDTSIGGAIEEVGAYGGLNPLGSAERLLFQIPLMSTAAGMVVFAGQPADESPQTDVLLFGRSEAVPPNMVAYGSVSLTVVASATTSTTTSLPTGSTTSTTLPSTCSAGPVFGSILCRLAELTSATSASTALGRYRLKLRKTGNAAEALANLSKEKCAAAVGRNALKKAGARLKNAGKKLAAYAKILRSTRAVTDLPGNLRSEFLARAEALLSDMDMLRQTLDCPGAVATSARAPDEAPPFPE